MRRQLSTIITFLMSANIRTTIELKRCARSPLRRRAGGGGSSFLSLHFYGAIFLLHRSRSPIGPACLTGTNDCAAARLDCDTSDI